MKPRTKHKQLITLIICGLIAVVAGIEFWGFVHGGLYGTVPKSHEQTTTTQASTSPAQQTPAPTSFDKTKFSVTDPASLWVIVNKQHPLVPNTYAPADLTAVGNGQLMRAEAAKALTNMFSTATKQAGLTLTAASGYRSYDTQVTVYNNEVASFGQAKADSESARPGYSEHQTGLAIDIAGGGCSIEDCFANTKEGKWVAANAYLYGFILRYTADNTKTTGYRAEAWHFRYVGIDLATEMHVQKITTLEEFFGVTGGPAYK